MAKARVKVPKTASAGEIITIKTLIKHPMESGQRKDSDGNVIPRKIINQFVASFNGVDVIDTALAPAISTNPYIQFSFSVPQTGDLVFKWTDDDGSVTKLSKTITVT